MALADDNVYLAKDALLPSFSNQAYDDSYALYLRGQGTTSRPRTNIKSSIDERRAVVAPVVREVAEQYGMDPALIFAVMEVESGFNQKAISPKGAIGAMQLLPKTAESYNVKNPYDLRQNLDGGTRYLKDLLRMHNGNLSLALAAYNAGKANVAKHHQRIPPFNETMLYVPSVLAKMGEYQYLNGMLPQ